MMNKQVEINLETKCISTTVVQVYHDTGKYLGSVFVAHMVEKHTFGIWRDVW